MIDPKRLQAWLQLPDTTKLNIFNETARRLGLPATAIEKDWWVVHTLALVFSMECAPALIFKGGTSLSKGWGLIQRFSEDIDLAIDREYLDYPGDLDRQTIKKLRKKSFKFMTETFLPELTAKFNNTGFTGIKVDYQHTGQSDQDPLIVEIYYPKLTEQDTYLKPGVLVEVGCRSLKEPITNRTFATMVAEQFNDRPFADAAITVPVVNPERTFLEKIFLLHEEFQKPSDKIRVNRLSRHLYDIEKLSQSQFSELALNDADLYQTIVDHRSRFTSIAGVDYGNHSPHKLAFVPPVHLLSDWEVDYREMRINMLYGDPLDFTELIQRLLVLQKRINNSTFIAQKKRIAFKQTEVGEIPEDWEVKKLKDTSDIKTGPFGSSLHEKDYVNDGIPIITVEHLSEFGIVYQNLPMVSDADRKRLNSYSLQKDDIVFSRVGSVDRNSIVSEREKGWLFSGRLLRIRVTLKDVAPQYLSFHFQQESFKQRIRSVAVGQTMASLNTQILKEIDVALPPTLAEQTAIATVLSDADALISRLKTLIVKKKDIKKGAMQELLRPKEDWEVKTLGEVLKVRHGKSQKEIAVPNGPYPILASGGIIGQARAYIYNKPSVLIGRKGTIDQPQYMETPFWSVDTLFYTEISEDYNAKFIFYMFNLIDWYAYNEASGVPSLNSKTIELIEKHFPKTLEEQTRIAQILSDMDTEIEKLQHRLSKQKQLKRGLMQMLLTGKIRII